MNEQALGRVEKRLDQIVRLFALKLSEGKKQADAIQILAAAGIERSLIAELLGTTPNTVSVSLSVSRSKKRIAQKAFGLGRQET